VNMVVTNRPITNATYLVAQIIKR